MAMVGNAEHQTKIHIHIVIRSETPNQQENQIQLDTNITIENLKNSHNTPWTNPTQIVSQLFLQWFLIGSHNVIYI